MSLLPLSGKTVLCVASSGIAAHLLPDGRTAHSRFGIPLDINELSVANIRKNTQLAELIRNTYLLIWDGVPMQHKFCFEAVHRTLQDICNNDLAIFGGIPIILGGDFAQILPIVCKGYRAQTIQACIQSSYLWMASFYNITTTPEYEGYIC